MQTVFVAMKAVRADIRCVLGSYPQRRVSKTRLGKKWDGERELCSSRLMIGV